MRGRKPKPTALRRLIGNPGKRPFNAQEPQPPALPTDCPAEIDTPDARTEWARVVAPAIARGQITADDRVFAIAHCELWATWRSQLADAARYPHVIAAGKGGYPMPNPARVMANRTLVLLARIDAELGFSPTARTRVQVTELGAKDWMDALTADRPEDVNTEERGDESGTGGDPVH